jgi:hypothetical protein
MLLFAKTVAPLLWILGSSPSKRNLCVTALEFTEYMIICLIWDFTITRRRPLK